jgi:hypothetical protein
MNWFLACILGLHGDGVLVGTAHHVGRTADQGLQGASAAREIGNLDVKSLGLEVAQLLGDCEGQVVEGGLAAHRDGNLAFFQLALSAQRRRSHGRHGQRRGGREGAPVQGDCFHSGNASLLAFESTGGLTPLHREHPRAGFHVSVAHPMHGTRMAAAANAISDSR